MLVVSPLQSHPLAIGDITTHVFRSAEPYRNDVVLIDAHSVQKFTIGGIITASNRLAAGLARDGRSGQVISVFDDTELRCVYVYYAALMVGGTYQSLGTGVSTTKLAERIKTTDSPVIFTTALYLDKLRAATSGMEVHIYLLDNACDRAPAFGCSCLSFAHLLVDDPSFVPVRITSKDDAMRKPAYLAYSASTEQHQEVSHQLMLSHYGLLSSHRLNRPRLPDSTLRTTLSTLPFTNTHGISNIAHFPMLSGSRVVQMSRNDPALCLAAMEQWKAGVFLATYPVLTEILAKAKRCGKLISIGNRTFDISSLQIIFMHELRMSESFKEKASELLGARIVELYGYIETGLISGVLTEYPRIPNSVGVLCSNVAARVMLDGREVEDGQCGEILVSTPRLTVVNSTLIDGTRYFCTGDYGMVTSQGIVIVKARVSDLIHTQSGVVVPGDIETELLKDVRVAECAAVAVSSNGMDVPLVFVVGVDAAAADASSVAVNRDYQTDIDPILAPLAKLYPGIHGRFIDCIPKSSRGEPERSALRFILAANHADNNTTAQQLNLKLVSVNPT
ncbi:hypothetical protein LPJ66_006747 [Kickxella alabastrina]|uniref:Uncharacterized protein n=1 Tax=Kickxella alabastrina TaxID=61397 RepID=A0ACC1IAS8_9FUNG|nr:hypothetical protein LPJ66_006747 [Kickxella alabastrina]